MRESLTEALQCIWLVGTGFKKVFTMLEEVPQQGRTLSRNEEGEPPAGINGRLPASILQELQLINMEV